MICRTIKLLRRRKAEYRPMIRWVIGSSRGGAVALNINSGEAKLVLLCPAWKNWGTAKKVNADTVILHSKADDVIPFADSEEQAGNSSATLIEVGNDYRLADPEPLEAMLKACDCHSKTQQLEWDRHHERVEYGIVRVARLLGPNRHFQGTPEVCRAPQVGDIGTLVYAYDMTSFAVECVNTGGMTVWLADFFAEELDFFGERDTLVRASERDGANHP